MLTLRVRNLLVGRRLRKATSRHLAALTEGPSNAVSQRCSELLAKLRNEPGPKVRVGDTASGEPVSVPLADFVKACGLTTGGMGSGKTLFALTQIQSLLDQMPGSRFSFGVLDPKGELFERALYLVWRRAEALPSAQRREFLDRVVVIDFASREAVTSYNILAPWEYSERDFFITSRLETLKELLPAGEKLSLRGANVLKHVLLLLSESSLPLTYLDAVLSDDAFRQKLVGQTKDPVLRTYFHRHFAAEGKQTIGALRARMDTLFAADSVRLALSGSSAPDFRRLQNEGAIVLINCAGRFITRGVRLLLQGLVLSDIRQAIFSRPNNPDVTYLWVTDEAQNLLLSRQMLENLTDVLTMARSYGTFFSFICQNLSASVPDGRILEQLHTNIRWSNSPRFSP